MVPLDPSGKTTSQRRIAEGDTVVVYDHHNTMHAVAVRAGGMLQSPESLQHLPPRRLDRQSLRIQGLQLRRRRRGRQQVRRQDQGIRAPPGPDPGALDAGDQLPDADPLHRRHQPRRRLPRARPGLRHARVRHRKWLAHHLASTRRRAARARPHFRLPRAEGRLREGRF